MASNTIGELQVKLSFDEKSLSTSMKGVAQQGEEAASKLSKAFNVAAKAIISDVAVKAFGAVTGAAKNFASSVVSVGSQFEASMSEVAAITGATGDELALLEQTAREYGASTVFSASESAQALKYMGLAGWDANQSVDALGGVLDLAAASGMELAAASDMVTDYLSAFGMEANQSGYFADMLTYAQNNANTTAEALGEAYKNCAANLNAAGQDIETTTSLLSMMANQGLKGSEAGTALNAVMRDMTAKMKDGSIAIGNTSVQVMDANGNYRDMTDILMDVEKATDGMGDAEKAAALSATFTSDSIKGLNLIMNAGVEEAAAFEEALRQSGGTAAETAAIMNANLSGQLKTLNSNYEEAAITVYNMFLPALTSGATGINGFVTAVITALNDGDPSEAIADFVSGFGDALYTGLTKLGAVIGKVVPVLLQAIVGILPKLLEGLIMGATNLVLGVANALPDILMAIVDAVLGIVDLLTSPDTLYAIMDAGITLLMALVDALPTVIQALLGALPMVVQNITTFLIESLPLLLDGAVQMFMALIEALPTIIEALVGALPSVIDAAVGFLTQPDTINMILDAAITVFYAIIDSLPAIIDALAGALPNIITSIVDFLTNPSTIMMLLNAAIKLFFALVNAVPKILGALVSSFGSLVGNLWNAITAMFGRFAENFGSFISGAFKGAINGVLSFIEGFINTPINVINGFIDIINGAFGWIGVNLGHINNINLPRMEEGGIVPGNSYSGDHNLIRANSGEMVITRSQQASLWAMIEGGDYGGNGDENDNPADDRPIDITNNYNINSNLDAEEVGDLVLESIRKAVA